MRAVKTAKIKSANFDAAKVDQVTQITKFLQDNYRIEINKYDPSQMRVVSLKKRYAGLFPIEVGDIWIHAVQEGVSASKELIKTILRLPNQMRVYDPLKEYFDSIQNSVPEESHIDKLLSYITIQEFDDQPEGYYKERAHRLLRQWLVSAVSCALGDTPNETALVLVGELQGQGKSHLAKFLCPPALENMFIKSNADGRRFNLERASVVNFMIFYDEMAGLTNSTSEEFKSTLSASKLNVKLNRDLTPIMRQRIGSVIASSNNNTGQGNNFSRRGFIHPSMGTRRFICIHIDEIDWNYIKDVDVDAIWAEALHLYNTPGYQYKLTRDDYAEFDAVNQRYIVETLASAAIQHIYEVAAERDEDGIEWLTATEVMNKLNLKRLIPADKVKYFTPEKIGEAMRSLGFARRKLYDSGARLYKYKVRPIGI